ncbi:MAG: hypothetical protein K6T85_15895, partial [Gorillibacterium sp.]|nr:hypothetical protein [Gorillibacterium sp.]
MKTGWLEIELRSELCAATGEGVVGVIDTEIAQEYGLPVIPAKRIKGCLHEVAKELCDWGVFPRSTMEALFGLPGQEKSSALYIQDAHFYKLPNQGIEAIENYDVFLAGLKRQKEITPAQTLDALTSLRTRTAIEDNSGSAKPNSLRTMRVLNKGSVMRCEIQLDTTKEQEDELLEWFEQCAKGLRNMGLGRTRGLGEVRCRIMGMETLLPLANESVRIDQQGNVQLRYSLHLDTPVMVPGQNGLYNTCEDWIPGSVILGALAGVYITDHALGENAHEDADFSRIFLRGGVKFGYAFPAIGDKVFYPCPASWLRV